MKEITRTLAFVVVAAVSVAVAAVAHFATKPKPLKEFEAVGTEFYLDFKDPADAKALEVIAYNEDTATVKDFSVKFQDGRWRIPSHHDYPADAEDRIYKTATSVIGIERGALAGRRAGDHEKFGVIAPPDPKDPVVESLKGIGQRIKLTKADGSTLADYIIGKKVESESSESRGKGDRYYVRKPNEDEVYVTKLDIDLSTKFSDWIETDLLKLSSFDLTELVVNKYSIEERQDPLTGQTRMSIRDREVNTLTKKTSADKWKLEGLNEETEEINEDNVREITNGLDDLKIVGVRPKPRGLNPDLSIDREFVRHQIQLDILVGDMAAKGFFLVPVKENELQLYADEGELVAATKEGIVYNLRFGKIFTGTEFEVEVGFASDKSGEKKKAEKKQEKTEKKKEEKKKDADKGAKEKETPGDDKDAADGKKSESDSADGKKDEDKEDLKKSRYLFVTAQFDEKYLGDKPQKPVEPKKPAGPPAPEDAKKSKPAKKKAGKSKGEETPKGDDGAPEVSKPDDAEKGEKSDPGEKTDDAAEKTDDDAEKTDDAEKKDPQAEYEAAKKKYEKDLKKYEDDLKDFNKKIEDGKKKAKEINDRFAGWYYVISAKSFENLRLARADLVKPKEKKEDEKEKDKPDEKKKPEPKEKPTPKKKTEPKEKKPATKEKPAPQKKPATKKQPPAGKKPESPKPTAKKKTISPK